MEEVRNDYAGELQRKPRQPRPKGPAKPPKSQKPKKKHGADFGLRIVAVIAAIIVWFILSITQYPTINRKISDVPVTLSLEGTIAKEKGLSALNFNDFTVDVEIQGMNYEIGTYTVDDLAATVDVTKVTKEGQYVLDIDVKSTHASDSCKIVSVSPSTIAVEFDRITEKKLPVSVEAPYISAADGYTLNDPTVTPNEIVLNGPENSLEKVAKVAAKINKTAKISEDTVLKADEIVLYDKDSNVITDTSITKDDSQTFTANFIVYKKKTVKFKLDVTGAPENFDVSSLPITFSPTEMTVITSKLNDSDVETRVIGTIPLSQLRLDQTLSYEIPQAAGEVNLGGESKVEVKIDSDEYTTGIFRIARSQIITKNKPEGKDVTIETLSLPAVTIIGPKSEIENIQQNDLVASVDLSDINKNGSYSKTATISISGHSKVWCFGSNEVQVVVADKGETTTTASSEETPSD